MRFDGLMVEIERSELRALAAFASRDEGRVNLACVCFEPASETAWATDGHVLLWTGPEGADPRARVARPKVVAVRELAQAAKATGPLVLDLSPDAPRWSQRRGDKGGTLTLVNVTPPPVEAIWPASEAMEGDNLLGTFGLSSIGAKALAAFTEHIGNAWITTLADPPFLVLERDDEGVGRLWRGIVAQAV